MADEARHFSETTDAPALRIRGDAAVRARGAAIEAELRRRCAAVPTSATAKATALPWHTGGLRRKERNRARAPRGEEESDLALGALD